MSVSAQVPYNIAVGNGASTVYPYTWQALLAGDIAVYIDGSLKTLNVDYTVTGLGVQTGGNVTFTVPPANGTRVRIIRQMVKQRLTDYQQQGDFLTPVVNPDFDRSLLIAQELDASISRAIRVPIYEQGSNMLLAPVATRKNTFQYYDNNGDLAYAVALASGTLSKSTIGQFLYDQSPGEIAAAVVPTSYGYPEGDVRRYGATTVAADNSAAINAALLVSSSAGGAACLPAGTWNITAPLVAPAGSSMYGHGRASVIKPANGIDGLQFTGSDDGITAQPRFFRDFRIVGTLSGTTNAAKGININAGAIDHVLFSNIAIFNFQYGMYVRGLYYSTIQSPWIQNCYHGIFFQDQSVNVYIQNPTIQYTSATTLITAAGFSDGISCQGAPEIEGLHIQGGSIYGFDYDIKFGLIFECQIEAVDISFSKKCPILFASTIGGMVIRDCWIELASSASGTWNDGGTGTGNLTGIFVAAITPTVNAKVHIDGNYIISDVNVAGTTGIYIGNSNVGMTVTDNQIIGFDVGIGGGNTLANSGTASSGVVIKNNTINVVQNTTSTGVYSINTNAILLNSLGADMETGPNYIVPGTGAAGSLAGTATITVPDQTTPGSQQFPVGTPVGVTLTLANGPDSRVTYYVLTSSGTSVTVAAIPGGPVIPWTGTGSIGNLRQLPVPVNYTALTPAGVTFFGRGAFHITLSDPAVFGVVLWQASGKAISLFPPLQLTGASGVAALITATGLPQFLAPVTTQNAICGVEDAGVGKYGMFQITTAAAINIGTTPLAGSFAGTGTKGLLNTAINYSYA